MYRGEEKNPDNQVSEGETEKPICKTTSEHPANNANEQKNQPTNQPNNGRINELMNEQMKQPAKPTMN